MQRKNPGIASIPNAPIDLTPLLDVIFIFLFAVILSNANATQTVQNQARAEVKEAKAGAEELQSEVDRLSDEVFRLDSKVQEAQHVRDAYEGEVIGKRVKIITIYCTYDTNDSSRRRLYVDAQGLEFEPIDFQSNNMENAYDRLTKCLNDYILAVRGTEEKAKSERAVILLHINTELIQRRDKERIDRIIEELDRTYEDVY